MRIVDKNDSIRTKVIENAAVWIRVLQVITLNSNFSVISTGNKTYKSTPFSSHFTFLYLLLELEVLVKKYRCHKIAASDAPYFIYLSALMNLGVTFTLFFKRKGGMCVILHVRSVRNHVKPRSHFFCLI